MTTTVPRNLPSSTLRAHRNFYESSDEEEEGGGSDSEFHPLKRTKLNKTKPPFRLHARDLETWTRAEELQSDLPSAFPSFLKLISRSHVSGQFVLGLPATFCQKHLPMEDKTIFLMNKGKQTYPVNYLVRRRSSWCRMHRFGGGWKHFSTSNKLHSGDVLVFQLVEPNKFQVYIVRAVISLEVDETEEQNNEPVEEGCKDIQASDLQLPLHVGSKYSELCRSQKVTTLHENLIPGLTRELVAGAVKQTVIIAEGIQAIKPDSNCSDLETWDGVLGGFESWGMVVEFLRERIRRLQALYLINKDMARESKQQEKVREQAKKEVSAIRKKLSCAEELLETTNWKISELAEKQSKAELLLEEVATAPW